MILVVSIISFILDGVLSKYLFSSLFIPLLTIISLIIIYPYFRNNNYRFLKYTFIIGLLYDISYANTLFYHTFIFLILGLIIILINYLFSRSLFININISIICIISYRVIDYLFLIIFKNFDISSISLFKTIYSSFLLNIVYCIILYIITEKYSKKHKILRGK